MKRENRLSTRDGVLDGRDTNYEHSDVTVMRARTYLLFQILKDLRHISPTCCLSL